MPSFNVTIRRLVSQEAKIVVTVPDGEAPLSNLPDFDHPGITWERISTSELSHDCLPIVEETPVPEIEEPDASEGQDRESYSDDQDRDDYSTEEETE